MTLPDALQTWPPTVPAAIWKALEDRAAMAARRSSVPSEDAVRVGAGVFRCVAISGSLVWGGSCGVIAVRTRYIGAGPAQSAHVLTLLLPSAAAAARCRMRLSARPCGCTPGCWVRCREASR
jgi:hypothetical protein